MFSIGFTREEFVPVEDGEHGLVGRLVIGSHEEHFVAHLESWSERDYVMHWQHALMRALEGRSSALITDMWTPAQSSHLVWWPLWKINREIVIHNQLLFFAQHGIVGLPPDIERLYSIIREHCSTNPEGEQLSEWRVSVHEVEVFLQQGCSVC